MNTVEQAIQNQKCQSCPMVCNALVESEKVNHEIEHITLQNLTTSPEVDEFIAESLLASPVGKLLAEVGITEQADIVEQINQGVLGAMEQRDEIDKELAWMVGELTSACAGPLKMRANRDGQEVTVTVCMSPQADHALHHEDVHVRRKTK